MRKSIGKLMAAVILATFMIGCEHAHVEKPYFIPLQDDISEYIINPEEGSSVKISYYSNMALTASIEYQSDEEDWLTVDPVSFGEDYSPLNYWFTVTATSENDWGVNRRAYLKVNYKDNCETLVIMQLAAPAEE